MLQRIRQTCRQFALKNAHARPSNRLNVTALEERATPATAFVAAPVDPPVLLVVGFPAAPTQTDVAPGKPIVRLDVMPAGRSLKVNALEWSDMMAGDPAGLIDGSVVRKIPPQESDAPGRAVDANAEDVAVLEAEWIAMQQTNQDV